MTWMCWSTPADPAPSAKPLWLRSAGFIYAKKDRSPVTPAFGTGGGGDLSPGGGDGAPHLEEEGDLDVLRSSYDMNETITTR